jgi:hypothetical protein
MYGVQIHTRTSCCPDLISLAEQRGEQEMQNNIRSAPLCVEEFGTTSMINFRILNMTTLVTTTCNLNILDVLNRKMNGNK